MNVLVLTRVLEHRPEPPDVEGIDVACVDALSAGADWLALRERAFRDEPPTVRPWTHADLQREFGSSGGGRKRVTWLARDVAGAWPAVCGAISVSPPSVNETASLHWLMVDPEYRGQGIGSVLLRTAEQYCWERGHRVLRLETHRGWERAVAFYRGHGYR